MKDFDTLRHRVEETAERLSSAQSERQQETQSLITILRDLEEKYSAQEKQFAYYKARLGPLEQSNSQLTSLIENLLDLIDRGFGESSLDPLRKASEMASLLLEKELAAEDSAVAAPDDRIAEEPAEPSADRTEAELDDVDVWDSSDEPVEAIADPGETENNGDGDAVAAETAPTGDEDVQVIQDLVELIDESPATSDMVATAEEDVVASEISGDDDHDGEIDGVTDLELEEVPLSYLEDDIEMASDDFETDINAVAAADLADTVAQDDDVPAVAEDPAQPSTDAVADGDIVFAEAAPSAEAWDQEARFEDVSDAVLALELEEDLSAGTADLPQIVKSAAAAFESSTTAEEVDTLAALAQAMENEASSSEAPAPPTSDIRSLMLRVEALAKKAEAMRLAQSEETAGTETASDAENTVSAPETGNRKSGVAA